MQIIPEFSMKGQKRPQRCKSIRFRDSGKVDFVAKKTMKRWPRKWWFVNFVAKNRL